MKYIIGKITAFEAVESKGVIDFINTNKFKNCGLKKSFENIFLIFYPTRLVEYEINDDSDISNLLNMGFKMVTLNHSTKIMELIA